MRFLLPVKYTLLALFLFILELVIFIFIGDSAGEIFHWVYRSLGAVYVSVIMGLLAFALVSITIFPFLHAKAQNSPKHFVLFSIIAAIVAMLPFWCAWFYPLFDEMSEFRPDQYWLGTTLILVIAMFFPFWVASRNFAAKLSHNN